MFLEVSFYLFFCMRINLTGIFGSRTSRFRVKYREKVMAVAVQASVQGTRFQDTHYLKDKKCTKKGLAIKSKECAKFHLKTRERVGESLTSSSLSSFSRYLQYSSSF